MKNNLKFFCLALLCLSCEDDPLPPCQLSQTGWVCQDQGTDSSKDPDLGVKGKMDEGSSNDVTQDLASVDVGPKVEMGSNPKNCREIKVKNLPTGNYDIEVDGQMIKVHCNNDINGGGWILVGRSVAGGGGVAFGWTQKSGKVDDDSAVYSLGSTSIPFQESLATNYVNGKVPGNRQYIVAIPNNFRNDCADTSCETTVRSPTQSCQNNLDGNDVFMLDYVGWISTNDFFWFREIPDDAGTGFRPDGWSLFFDDCRAGELNGQQGLLFVR